MALITHALVETRETLEQECKASTDHLNLVRVAGQSHLRLNPEPPEPLPSLALEIDDDGTFGRPPPADASRAAWLKGAGDPRGRGADSERELAMALSIEPILTQAQEALPDVVWVYYSSQQEFILAHPYLDAAQIPFESGLTQREYFTNALPEVNAERENRWTQAYLDGGGKGLMITVSGPIYDGDRFVGALSLDVTLARLSRLLAEHRPRSMSVLVRGAHGQVIAWPAGLDERSTLVKQSEFVPAAALEALEQAPPHELSIHNGWVVSRHPLEGPPWEVISYVPQQRLWGVVLQQMAPELIISALLLIALAAVVLAVQSAEESRWQERRAARANRTKTDFLSTVSHELRIPLNGVLGMARALANQSHPAALQADLNQIVASGELLLEILNDLLDMRKIESGQLTIETRSFDLASLVEGLEAILAHRANSEVALRFETRIHQPYRIGDTMRLRQILMNLLSNSLKFTHSGEVVLRVEERTRDPEAYRVRFSVRDTGIGIDSEAVQRVFEPFEQASTSTARRYGGTGLGLPIAKNLVEAMGGEMQVHSEVGRGTTLSFTLTLPVATTTGISIRRRVVPLAARALRVLVVEDDDVTARIVQMLLEQAGHEVFRVDDGAVALSRVEELQPHLVLMDRNLPELNGLETTRRLRALLGPASRVPVCGFTASLLPEEVQECYAAGMEWVLGKPLDPGELMQIVREVSDALGAAES